MNKATTIFSKISILIALTLAASLSLGDDLSKKYSLIDQDNKEIQYKFGLINKEDQSTSQTYKTALKWFTRAAELGNAQAQNNLGVLYLNGLGAPLNYKTALKWFSRSAESGNAQAQNNLGVLYLNGLGAPLNYKTALKWFTRAAELGNAQAQNNLGLMYKNAQGVPQSFFTAVVWFVRSALKGNTLALSNVQSTLGIYLYVLPVLFFLLISSVLAVYPATIRFCADLLSKMKSKKLS